MEFDNDMCAHIKIRWQGPPDFFLRFILIYRCCLREGVLSYDGLISSKKGKSVWMEQIDFYQVH